MGHYGICENVNMNLAMFFLDQCGKCVIFCCRLKTFITTRKKSRLHRAEKESRNKGDLF